MKLFKHEKDYDFYFFAVFDSVIIFALCVFAYGGFWVPLILAFLVFIFLRFTRFIYCIILKAFGILRDKKL